MGIHVSGEVDSSFIAKARPSLLVKSCRNLWTTFKVLGTKNHYCWSVLSACVCVFVVQDNSINYERIWIKFSVGNVLHFEHPTQKKEVHLGQILDCPLCVSSYTVWLRANTSGEGKRYGGRYYPSSNAARPYQGGIFGDRYICCRGFSSLAWGSLQKVIATSSHLLR